MRRRWTTLFRSQPELRAARAVRRAQPNPLLLAKAAGALVCCLFDEWSGDGPDARAGSISSHCGLELSQFSNSLFHDRRIFGNILIGISSRTKRVLNLSRLKLRQESADPLGILPRNMAPDPAQAHAGYKVGNREDPEYAHDSGVGRRAEVHIISMNMGDELRIPVRA